MMSLLGIVVTLASLQFGQICSVSQTVRSGSLCHNHFTPPLSSCLLLFLLSCLLLSPPLPPVSSSSYHHPPIHLYPYFLTNPSLLIWLCVCLSVCLSVSLSLSPVSHLPQVVSLSVDYGSTVTLPCNGSAYVEEGLQLEEGEEGEIRWEAVGSDVAFFQSGELVQGPGYEGRVRFAPEPRLKEGDWSLFLGRVRQTDADMYECLRGRRTVSTVWLKVNELSVETSVTAWLGDSLHLPCILSVQRSQSSKELSVWWLRNDNLLVSYNQSYVTIEDEDTSRFTVEMGRSVEEFVLYVNPVLFQDQGEYRCFYKTRANEKAKPGFPEIITVAVLGQESTATETDAWADMGTEGRTAVGTTESPAHPTPVFLDDWTHAEQVGTTPQPMEAQEETATSFPEEEGSLQKWLESIPWVRIGLIAGVLVVTAVTLCVLGSLRKI